MINTENYESYLFLYQEGELNSTERKEVEAFLVKHPVIREEMETYYDPTLVVTTEPPARKSTRITSLWRWAAAACVVLALGYGVYLALPQPTNNGSLIAETTTQNKQQLTTLKDSSIYTPILSPVTVSKPLTASTNRKKQAIIPSLQSLITHPNTVEPLQLDEQAFTKSTIQTEVIPSENQTAPDIIICNNLADDIIYVDNLAADMPNSTPYPTTSSSNIAELLAKNLQERKQQYLDFFREELLSSPNNYQLAKVI